MSLSMMQEAVRITDRFYGVRDTETIERQGRLQNAIVLVFIFHMIMVVAFIKLQEFEVAHPRIVRDVDVSFEFTPPPPEPPPKPLELPRSLSLTAGENPNPGSEAAPTPLKAATQSMPSLEAPRTMPTPTQVTAAPVPSHRTTVAAPVAVTATNVIKAKVGQVAPREAPKPPPTPMAMAAAPSNQPLSGTQTPGGAPGANEGGTGAGGQGQGGTGVGQGTDGAGTGDGAAGGQQIATRLPTTATQAMFNIAPYRKDLLARLAKNWHPKKSFENLIVLITLDHDGHLVGSEIFQSSGNRKADKEALDAVEATEFAPLPDVLKRDTLTFKIQMSKVEATQTQ